MMGGNVRTAGMIHDKELAWAARHSAHTLRYLRQALGLIRSSRVRWRMRWILFNERRHLAALRGTVGDVKGDATRENADELYWRTEPPQPPEGRRLSKQKALEILSVAIDLEKEAQTLYEAKGEATRDPNVRDLLRRWARGRERQIDRLQSEFDRAKWDFSWHKRL
jgi:rubrerythrin